MIVMIAKVKRAFSFYLSFKLQAKPTAKQDDNKQKMTPAVTLEQPAQSIPVQPTSVPVTSPPVKQSSPPVEQSPVDEETLNDLIAISGASKDRCTQAIRAAKGDPNLAFEFLQSGIPATNPRAFNAVHPPQPLQTGSSNAFASFVNNPQF